MPLIPLGNCLVQSTSFPHASIRVIRSIRAIRDTSCRSSCCRFPSRSLRLCERQKPFSPPFLLCSLKTRSQSSVISFQPSELCIHRSSSCVFIFARGALFTTVSSATHSKQRGTNNHFLACVLPSSSLIESPVWVLENLLHMDVRRDIPGFLIQRASSVVVAKDVQADCVGS